MGKLDLDGVLDEDDLRRERARARDLRRTQWWKNKRSSGVCHYCRGVFPPKMLTMDHLVPLVRGGRSAKSNLVPCCKKCNGEKKNLLPIEWQEYLDSMAGGSGKGTP